MSKYEEYIEKTQKTIEELEKNIVINSNLSYNLLKLDDKNVSTNFVIINVGDHEREYPKLNESGFAYQFIYIQLANQFMENGIELSETITNKAEYFSQNINPVLLKEMSEIGEFTPSALKYLLSTELGIRTMFEDVFGPTLINDQTFPKLDVIKNELEVMQVYVSSIIKREIIKGYNEQEVKQEYLKPLEIKATELNNSLMELKLKIEAGGMFTTDTHPTYQKILSEYNELITKIEAIKNETTPEIIDNFRQQLLHKFKDYKAELERLNEGKKYSEGKTKGEVAKELLNAKERKESYSVYNGNASRLREKVMQLQQMKEQRELLADIINNGEYDSFINSRNENHKKTEEINGFNHQIFKYKNFVEEMNLLTDMYKLLPLFSKYGEKGKSIKEKIKLIKTEIGMTVSDAEKEIKRLTPLKEQLEKEQVKIYDEYTKKEAVLKQKLNCFLPKNSNSPSILRSKSAMTEKLIELQQDIENYRKNICLQFKLADDSDLNHIEELIDAEIKKAELAEHEATLASQYLSYVDPGTTNSLLQKAVELADDEMESRKGK